MRGPKDVIRKIKELVAKELDVAPAGATKEAGQPAGPAVPKKKKYIALQYMDAEEFERLLNKEDGINNLDLNEDGKVDYIEVEEYGTEALKGFSLTVEVEKGQEQEIATIEVEKTEGGEAQVEVQLVVVEKLGEGAWLLRPRVKENHLDILERFGDTPLPPYIHRGEPDEQTDKQDRQRYQTVYADKPGSVAAPTAGLHFTAELLQGLEKKGVNVARLTCHVGFGTFKPVTTERLEDHQMHQKSPLVFLQANHVAMSRELFYIGTLDYWETTLFWKKQRTKKSAAEVFWQARMNPSNFHHAGVS